MGWRRGVAGQPAGGLATFSRLPVGTVSYRSFRGALPNMGRVVFRAKRALNSLLQGVHVEFLPPGSSGHRIDYVLVSGDEERFPVIDSGLLFAEPLARPGERRMYLSDHVALTTRVGLTRPPRPVL